MNRLNRSAVPLSLPGRVRRFPARPRRLASDFLAPGTQPDPRPGSTVAQLGYLSVLVVDDDPVNLLCASEMLAFWGIRALEARDGKEAVALVRELRLDLILMDLEMPLLDGLGASHQIRRLEREHARPRVPIVLCTGSGRFVLPAELGQSGVDALLDKPCPAQDLHDCLVRWCLPTVRGGAGTPTGESGH